MLKNSFTQDVLHPQGSPVLIDNPEDWAKKLDATIRFQPEKGKIKVSSSWEEISDWMGLSSGVLHQALDEYNTFCDAGYDADL